MQELAKNLNEATDPTLESPIDLLKKANEKWSKFVLENNIDIALKWGLEISRAIAEYIATIEE